MNSNLYDHEVYLLTGISETIFRKSLYGTLNADSIGVLVQ